MFDLRGHGGPRCCASWLGDADAWCVAGTLAAALRARLASLPPAARHHPLARLLPPVRCTRRRLCLAPSLCDPGRTSAGHAARALLRHAENLLTLLFDPVFPHRPVEDSDLNEFHQIFLTTSRPASLCFTCTRAYSLGARPSPPAPRTQKASLALTLI